MIENTNNFINPQYNLEDISEGLISFFKSIIMESLNQVMKNKMYENVVLDQNLTSKQLCERWNISKNTLHSWEERGVISPIPTGGRKKLYSLKEVREVESEGYIKNVG